MQAANPTPSPESQPTSPRNSDVTNTRQRKDRPCDACRRRKSRCVINENARVCVLCEFHHQKCTFVEIPLPRKRKPNGSNGEEPDRGKIRVPRKPIRTDPLIGDYANLKGPSLLKKTLGLQNHRHGRYIGHTAEYETCLLDLRMYDEKSESAAGHGCFRKVSDVDSFYMLPDESTQGHQEEIDDLDAIEQIVAPHGEALIKLYFRIVHPSFPILHKKVFLEKYSRTHREFSPPLLAAVYILALNWWSYSSELASLDKPNVVELEKLAFKTINDVMQRPKLSTVQAGLLLLQRPQQDFTWPLTAQLVAIGQELGLHLDASGWHVPTWECGLRKRLAWALYMQDTWAALIYGRPPHLSLSNWTVRPVVGSDFPESAADEDEEDGSTEVEKGRALFSKMIELSLIVAEILEALYSQQAERDIQNSAESTILVLERAKPIQLRLRSWHVGLPECLRMDSVKLRKLSSIGYLHLAYFATEMTLHRRIIRSLSSSTGSHIVQICRTAAKARLVSALDFFGRLKPEHLQSFWYFASKVNFALIGTFSGLLWITSSTSDEAEFYEKKLQEYRWTLRVLSKGAEFLDIACGILERSIGVLIRAAEGAGPNVKKISGVPPADEETDDFPEQSKENYTVNGSLSVKSQFT